MEACISIANDAQLTSQNICLTVNSHLYLFHYAHIKKIILRNKPMPRRDCEEAQVSRVVSGHILDNYIPFIMGWLNQLKERAY